MTDMSRAYMTDMPGAYMTDMPGAFMSDMPGAYMTDMPGAYMTDTFRQRPRPSTTRCAMAVGPLSPPPLPAC